MAPSSGKASKAKNQSNEAANDSQTPVYDFDEVAAREMSQLVDMYDSEPASPSATGDAVEETPMSKRLRLESDERYRSHEKINSHAIKHFTRPHSNGIDSNFNPFSTATGSDKSPRQSPASMMALVFAPLQPAGHAGSIETQETPTSQSLPTR